jgi:hypothetical protein
VWGWVWYAKWRGIAGGGDDSMMRACAWVWAWHATRIGDKGYSRGGRGAGGLIKALSVGDSTGG